MDSASVTIPVFYLVPGDDMWYENTLDPVESIFIHGSDRKILHIFTPINNLVTENPNEYIFEVIGANNQVITWKYNNKKIVSFKFK